MAKDGILQIKILGDSKPLERTLKGLPGKVSKFGLAAGAAGVTALAGLGAFSIKTFADFDQAMTNSTAIMGDLSDAMRDEMSTAAREVAKTTKFSATEAAESYFFLASAGLDAAQSIEALPKVAAFAQAGNFDMALATDLLTDAQSALGLAVDDTAENLANLTNVSDVLVKANTLANSSVQQFSEALTNKAGASMRSLNMDLEEGVAVLGVFADQGIKGSQAGTTFNAVIRGLTDGARKNAEEFEKLGVEVFNSSGEMNNMADIVAQMEGALDGMSVEQQRAALASMGFTEETVAGTLALLGNSEAIREYERDLQGAAGTTADVADNQLQTFWAQLGLVKDNLVDVALSIGEALMPALMGFVDWLQAHLPSITNWFSEVGGKFSELLGVSEETSSGMISHLDGLGPPLAGMESNVAQAMVGAGGSMDDLKGPLDNLDQNVINAMVGVEDATAQFKAGADENFAEAGTFMDRLGEAWKTIWYEDLQPWFMNTMLPWLENTFFPALIDAFMGAGKLAGKALASEVTQAINNSLRSWTPSGLAGRVSERIVGSIPGIDMPTLRGNNGGGTFHDGGVIPGRRGQEVPILAMAGETVLPTHKPGVAAQMGRSTTFNVTQTFNGSDPRIVKDSEMSLKKLALLGAY